MSNLVPKYSGPYGDEFDAAYSSMKDIIDRFKASIDDGFQINDIAKWHGMIVDSYDVAKVIFPDGFGRDHVTEIARYIYWAIDPNWPWIPEPIETQLEKWIVIDIAIPMAVNAAWDAVESYVAKNDSN